MMEIASIMVSMESKVIELKSGRKITRYKASCTNCGADRGYKDRNHLYAMCCRCSNTKINAKKKGKSGIRANKYKHIENIDTDDYIQVGNVTKFMMSCIRCGGDKGYCRPDIHDKPCRSCSHISTTVEDCTKIGDKLGFDLVSNKYEGYDVNLKWQCRDCEFVFNRSISSMKSKGIGNCPHCNRFSNENECRKIFEDIFDKHFVTVRPDSLKNPETNYNLELDGYCEELKLAFEYDGEFHYKDMGWTSKRNRLEKRQARDRLKDVLCEQNGIILIRIPYWEKDNLKEYINQQLIENGVMCA